MSIGTMILLGLIVGFVTNKLVMRTGDGLLRDLALGAAGAVVTGGLLNLVGTHDASQVNVFGMVAALAGAAAALVVYHRFYPHVSVR
ncbi:MAG: hypothetical protein MUC55_08820 [Burkholderiales bacterium]|jgi:uncharacterized membrane protein YeaQ/YmgE (transglycosylase-associated protein family)|nr:hypothetical protein [Burkholderiales bacterium]